MRIANIIAALVITGSVPACQKGKADTEKGAPPVVSAAPTAAPPPKIELQAAAPSATPSAAPKKDVVELKIESVGDTMAFNLTSLTVKSGQEVHLVFHNNAKMPVMSHNWVLVKPGTEAAVAAEGLKAGADKGYLPSEGNADVLAHTGMATPGADTEVTFTAPAPGTYPYVCTVVGHYVVMKGVLTVTQ
ncbi:MAG: cupredoxin domain-containing protein [Deltaproteobacteria bacterium]|nr:cupredoxin domain-containing protein [Deltaproteobacteria bacterium]